LAQLRKRIDRLDSQLLRLLNDRARLALKVGGVKKQNGLPVFDRKREASLIKRLISENAGPLETSAVEKVFREILLQVRRFEMSSINEASAVHRPRSTEGR